MLRYKSITQMWGAQGDSQAQPGHQLKCLIHTNLVSSCIQLKRRVVTIPIISTFPPIPSLPTQWGQTQLHPYLPKGYTATPPTGTWEMTVYFQQNSIVICRSCFENLLVQMPITTWQGLTDIIRELDCFKGHYPRK